MRIISGIYKGRHIYPPAKFRARPTTDFAKEALFNIIENNFEISELSVLDLFSGTGSITYEFASRGARRITAVEKDTDNFKFIRNTLQKFDMMQVNPVRSDAYRIIRNPWESYDIIFADPPYDLKELKELPELILGSRLMVRDSWLILEHPSKLTFNHIPAIFDHRNYGSVNFSFFKCQQIAEN